MDGGCIDVFVDVFDAERCVVRAWFGGGGNFKFVVVARLQLIIEVFCAAHFPVSPTYGYKFVLGETPTVLYVRGYRQKV